MTMLFNTKRTLFHPLAIICILMDITLFTFRVGEDGGTKRPSRFSPDHLGKEFTLMRARYASQYYTVEIIG